MTQPQFRNDIAQVDAALQRLAAVGDDLSLIRSRAAALVDQTRWQSRSARAFRDGVDRWQEGIAVLGRPIDRLRESLLAARGQLELFAEGVP